MASPSVGAPDAPEPVPLGPLEDLFWRVEEKCAGAFRGVALVRLDGCVEADVLRAALHRLQLRHPKLRASVARNRNGRRTYTFDHPIRPIPFQITDHSEGESPWREEARRLLQIEFDGVGPFAEVGVLRNTTFRRSDVFLMMHHGIADGLSFITLLDDLLAEYANAEAHAEVPVRPARPIVTAARAASPGGWRRRLWLVRRLVRLQLEERRSRVTCLPEAPNVTPQSQWAHWVFVREETVRLVRRCRRERTSLGALLIAATCRALVDCLPESDALFKCQVPFDIRETLQGPAGRVAAEDLGCFVSIMNEFYAVQRRTPLWDLARRVHQDVETFLEQGGPAFYYNIATAAARNRLAQAAPRLSASSGKRLTLLATNYGVLGVRDAYGSLRPTACTLAFKNDRVGPSLVMEALVLGQRLNIGFGADRLEPGFWNDLHTAVRGYLDAAAEAHATTV